MQYMRAFPSLLLQAVQVRSAADFLTKRYFSEHEMFKVKFPNNKHVQTTHADIEGMVRSRV